MVALAPLQDIAHDIFLCAGLGFFTAVLYSLLLTLFGFGKVSRFVADCCTIVVGTLAWFALSVQGLSTGAVRWYTAAGVLAGHLLCLQLWWAYLPMLHRILLLPQKGFRRAFIALQTTIYTHLAKKHEKNCTKKHRNSVKHLQKVYNVLYNSNYETNVSSFSH